MVEQTAYDPHTSSGPASVWTAALTSELSASLSSFRDMDDPGFRRLILRGMGERLGLAGSFPAPYHADARDHIRAIVYGCKDHRDPVAAVTALVATVRAMRPDEGAVDGLEDCEATVKGLSVLGAPRLHSVLGVLATLSGACDRVLVHELARRVFPEGLPPLRGHEQLPEVVRRLDAARETIPAAVPVVIRFLIMLAAALTDEDRSRLTAEVEEIVGELDLPLDSVRGVPAHTLRNAARTKRILQIRITDVSRPGTVQYAIDGAVLDDSPGGRDRIAWWRSAQTCSADNIDEAGRTFLAEAQGLGQSIGLAEHLVVEFLLPWPLLGHPVERWGIDEDGYMIGHRFPVVVRSLDRQHKEMFYRPWRERWDMLFSAGSDKPLRDRIGWLHHGEAPMPAHASSAGRVLHLTGQGDLTRWLEKEENRDVASLGLTVAYRLDDHLAVTSVKDAVREGIPVLLWRRDSGDANELERLLSEVTIHHLPDKVRSWRRMTAGGGSTASDARYHVVLMWDDPDDVIRPSEQFFTAPHEA